MRLPPAHPSSLKKNDFNFEQYYKMLTTSPEVLAPELHGSLVLLNEEATENSKIVSKWRDVMFVDQGQRRICWTCAFLSMLCKLLSEQGIEVNATSMLAQMDAAGPRWLAGAGTQPRPGELEEFMEKTWFQSKTGTEFRVSIATSVCVNPQCMLQADKRNKTAQTSFERVLFKDLRECHTKTKFLLGGVNPVQVFVHGEIMRDVNILHDELSTRGHMLGLLHIDSTRVIAWNSWGGASKLLQFPPRCIHSFQQVSVTQIEVRDSAQGVTCLMDTKPEEESGWYAHSTSYSDAEDMLVTSSMVCDKKLYCRQVSKYVKTYASQPMRETAMKQQIKPLPAPAHNSDSTQNPPKKKRKTGGV